MIQKFIQQKSYLQDIKNNSSLDMMRQIYIEKYLINNFLLMSIKTF